MKKTRKFILRCRGTLSFLIVPGAILKYPVPHIPTKAVCPSIAQDGTDRRQIFLGIRFSIRKALRLFWRVIGAVPPQITIYMKRDKGRCKNAAHETDEKVIFISRRVLDTTSANSSLAEEIRFVRQPLLRGGFCRMPLPHPHASYHEPTRSASSPTGS
jgi:hypothetical protein